MAKILYSCRVTARPSRPRRAALPRASTVTVSFLAARPGRSLSRGPGQWASESDTGRPPGWGTAHTGPGPGRSGLELRVRFRAGG
jgi:hypothetical protein